MLPIESNGGSAVKLELLEQKAGPERILAVIGEPQHPPLGIHLGPTLIQHVIQNDGAQSAGEVLTPLPNPRTCGTRGGGRCRGFPP